MNAEQATKLLMQEPTQLISGEGRSRWSRNERISSIDPAGVTDQCSCQVGSFQPPFAQLPVLRVPGRLGSFWSAAFRLGLRVLAHEISHGTDSGAHTEMSAQYFSDFAIGRGRFRISRISESARTSRSRSLARTWCLSAVIPALAEPDIHLLPRPARAFAED